MEQIESSNAYPMELAWTNLSVRISYSVPTHVEFERSSIIVSNFISAYMHEWAQIPTNEDLAQYLLSVFGNEGEMVTYDLECSFNLDELMNTSDEDMFDDDLQFVIEQTQYSPPSPRNLKKREILKLKSQLECFKCVQNPKEDTECIICTESVLSGRKKKVKLKKCGHMFHFTCLQKWVSCNPSCPICRSPIELV